MFYACIYVLVSFYVSVYIYCTCVLLFGGWKEALGVCLYPSYLSMKAKSLTVHGGHQSTQLTDQLSPGSLHLSHSSAMVLGPEEVQALMFPWQNQYSAHQPSCQCQNSWFLLLNMPHHWAFQKSTFKYLDMLIFLINLRFHKLRWLWQVCIAK